MRAIKFRGKSKIDGEWFYGNLYDKDNRGRTHICTTSNGCLDIAPDTVGQFTGLFDKNEKEIYEGDIVRFEGTQSKSWNAVVSYHYENAAFLLDRKDTSRGIDGGLSKRLTVIGNIYDNPELLKMTCKRMI